MSNNEFIIMPKDTQSLISEAVALEFQKAIPTIINNFKQQINSIVDRDRHERGAHSR